MSGHTKGPWSIEWGVVQGGDGHRVIDSTGDTGLDGIANVLFHDDDSGEETRSNARLIAAAPDLLTACQSSIWLLEKLVSMDRLPADNAALRECKAAVAKLEGKA